MPGRLVFTIGQLVLTIGRLVLTIVFRRPFGAYTFIIIVLNYSLICG
ncbi:MAG: hypothetical protein IKI19_09020 [Prevotella sp.]|nr:hypothetical protein [Prevotella sp.]MBR6998924.1 hypothetical protein [Prevotella sp.]